MIKSDWKAIAELIGIAAIVASLIFVGLQMKQSHEIAIADQYQSRADAAIQHYDNQLLSESVIDYRAIQFMELAQKADTDADLIEAIDTYGADTVSLAYLRWRSNMTVFDNYHFQYEQGFLTENAWLAFENRLRYVLMPRVHTAFWGWQAGYFRESFQAVCAELVKEIQRDDPAGARSMLW